MRLRVAGLHLQLLGLILLPFSIILFVVALAGVRVHQDAMRRLIAERDERATRAAAAALSQQLHHRDFAMRGLASRLADQSDATTIVEEAEFLLLDFDAGIAILDAAGAVLASSSNSAPWEDRPLQELLDRRKEGWSVFSEPFIERDQPTVMVAAYGDEKVAVGAFRVSRIFQTTLLSSVLATGDATAFLTDATGAVLQHIGTLPDEDEILLHPGVASALRGEFGSYYRPAMDGEHVVAFSPIEPTHWALIVEEPWESVSSPLLDASLAAPLALIPAFLVSLVGLWFGARQVIQPLRELQDRAEHLALDEPGKLEASVGGIAEIRQLQDTLVRMARQLRAAREALQGYIGAITEAQEEERHRLARDLHDQTIQDLIAVDQRIQMLGMAMQPDNQAQAQQLDDLHREVTRAIRDVRRLTRALRPVYLDDLGLIPAIEMLAGDFQREHDTQVEVSVSGIVFRMGAAAELAMFRIIQEALSNISRHASARTVSITMQFGEHSLEAEVRDDGVGFEVPSRISDMAVNGHFGLMGMHERAEIIGAQLNIESRAEQGTTVRFLLNR